MALSLRQGSRCFALVAACVIVAWGLQTGMHDQAIFEPGDTLTVWVFDVGQGDAIFIDAPDMQILIDGGPSDQIIEKLTAVMPFYDRTIDLVINTHPHADHINGLVDVLERYEVGEVWVDGQEYGSEAFLAFEDLAAETYLRHVQNGEVVELGSGATLEVLWPLQDFDNQYLEDPNDGSIITLLEYQNFNMILTGDAGIEQESEIIDELDHIDVLKVGHHGSSTSSGRDFLQAITPDYAVISVGENNSHGHPHDIVLDRLRNISAEIIRTDLHGDVKITSNGSEPEISLVDL